MNIYSKKQRWKLLLFIGALVIVIFSLLYTNSLVKKIARDERDKVSLWAEAIQRKANLVKYTDELFQKIETEERKRVELWALANKEMTKDLKDYTFVLEVLKNNVTIPVIITDEEDKVNFYKNINPQLISNPQLLKAELDSMRQQHPRMEIEIGGNKKNYLYYRDSRLFSEIRIAFNGLIQSFITEVAVNSASVPVIYTDSTQKKVIAYGKLDTSKIHNPAYLENTIAEMAAQNAPIEVDLGESGKNYIFYQQSFLLKQLKYYPYVQFCAIGLFLIIAYTLFSTARNAEQNQVWVGMAKETAHQLGTPLSSLIAWVEYLKLKNVNEEVINEMRKDIGRLETITERFSKIGSIPLLEKQNIVEVLTNAIDYMKTRSSKNINFSLISSSPVMYVPINVPLFEWVIENICKNAIDAMTGKGSVTITVSDQVQFMYIDISDTGKGIVKSKFKTVFEPGYTTKQRGWGLGLSLVKRIIENYHSGKIFVKTSEVDKGTTFRIVLNKQSETSLNKNSFL